MTIIDCYKREIIEAAEFLKSNPNWEPSWTLPKDPARAIGELVQELSED